ncbi:MAG: hypothetical protein JEZ06_18865 [Anaerolineaceae bacterium]|nr:hypothetical protein [Anaerolineaceae bacterium]
MKLENSINKILKDVPGYEVFLTVDELDASTQELAKKFPEIIELQQIGYSRQGSPITVLKIGNGPKKALLFALPHPNEPIGSMMLEYLTARLAEDENLREDFGYTWYIIKCVDPDGTRLNEDWFKGPFTATNYARHFYRPPSHLQVEWTFPVKYKTLNYSTPLPETQALMDLIEKIKPDFIYSLHNSGFGGVYVYMSEEAPEFTEPFYKLVKEQNLPLHLGEPEMPMLKAYSPAIFGLPTIQEMYDFMEQNTDTDPAITMAGSSSFEYAQKFCEPLVLICEMPYWHSAAINDTSPSDMVRKEAVLQNLAESRKYWKEIGQVFETARTYLTKENPFEQTIEKFIEQSEISLIAMESFSKANPDFEETATVAEKFDNLTLSKFYQLLSTGMLVRMIEMELDENRKSPELALLFTQVKQQFDLDTTLFESGIIYERIPIQKLVRVQLGSALLMMNLLKNQT